MVSLLLAVLILPIIVWRYFSQRKAAPELKAEYQSKLNEHLFAKQNREQRLQQVKEHLANRHSFFNKDISEAQLEEMAEKELEILLKEEEADFISQNPEFSHVRKKSFRKVMGETLVSPLMPLCIVLAPVLYMLIYIFSQPYAKFIFERMLMMIFVIFGVTWLVFTILYLSPMDPAKNILGVTATPEQVAQFNKIYGLDKPYIIQLLNTFKNLLSFNLGKSYVGNEVVMTAIANKFPITLILAFGSLVIALLIAIPAGIISAIKQYSSFDYIFMIIALIGLSIPNFWLGLVMILTFSIRLHWVPATYVVGNWTTMIMPWIVIGTSLSATVARMTRSSILEVKNMEYVMTAKAKGISERRLIFRHILSNAMIPIITVVGLQFGGILGGAAVTEKVFNINGLGSYIVDKQFVPDVPIVLAGVIYVAAVISLTNLFVDILYSFLDPQIKSRMKQY